RTEPLDDAAGGQAEAADAGRLHRDEVAVLRVAGRAFWNDQLLAEHLLFDRFEPAAARALAEDAEHAVLRPVDDADDLAAVADAGVLFGLFDAQQHAVAQAGGFAAARMARHEDADLRRGAVRLLVPFVRGGDEIAVTVARDDVGEHGRGQGARMMQLLVPLLDRAFIGEVAQKALQLGT